MGDDTQRWARLPNIEFLKVNIRLSGTKGGEFFLIGTS